MNNKSQPARTGSQALRREPQISVIVETRDADFLAAMMAQLRG